MRIGATFPTTEIRDPGAVRAFAQAVDEMGYSHLTAFDHVLGVHLPSHPGYYPYKGPNHQPHYSLEAHFHEIFVLFGFLAAVTKRVELTTGILIMPQRQTALIAKQAAEIDILTGGRLRLGVAVGHTDIEYKGLGVDFKQRAALIEEQFQVLRMLWTQPVVNFKGRFHELDAVGLNPLPMQRPIPLWMGGFTDAVARRAARVADGIMGPDPQAVRRYAKEAGRDLARFGISGNLPAKLESAEQAAALVKQQAEAGVTHLTVNTMYQGHTNVDQHIFALRQYKTVLGI